MSRLLAIFLILIITVMVTVVSIPYLLSWFDLDKKITQYIITQLTSKGEEIITVDDVDLGFAKVRLSNIKFTKSTSAADFNIHGIQFNYSLFKLLQNIDAPYKSIDKIFLLEPRVIIKESTVEQGSESSSDDTSAVNLIEILYQFENIDRIYLRNGEILFRRTSGTELLLAQNLTGWINSLDFSSVTVNAVGNFFDLKESSFNLFSELNLIDEEISSHIKIENFNLKKTNLINIKEDVKVENGTVDCHFDIYSREFALDSIVVNGKIDFSNLSLKFFNSTIHKLNLTAQISDNKLEIESGKGFLDKSKFSLSASMEDILKPGLSGSLKSNNFQLKPFAQFLKITEIEDLTLSMSSEFSFSPDDYSLAFNLSAPELLLKTQTIQNFHADMTIENDYLTINELRFRILGVDIINSSRVNIRNGVYDGVFTGTKELGNYIFFDRLANSELKTTIMLKGNIKKEILEGIWFVSSTNAVDTLLNYTGNVTLTDGHFNFSKVREGKNDFFFSLDIANIFNNPTINFGYIENPPIQMCTNNKWINDFAKTYQIEGIVAGPINNLSSQILIQGKSHKGNKLLFTNHIKNLMASEKYLDGKISLNRFEGVYSFTMNENSFLGKLNSNGSLEGTIDIDLSRDEQINSYINFSQLDFGLFLHDSTSQDHGELSGKIKINGNFDNPIINANLMGDKFILNDIGYYKFDTRLYADTNYVNIDTAIIALNNVPIINGNLTLDLNHKLINSRARGKELDADYIFQTLFDKKDLISGKGDFNLEIDGPIISPNILAEIQLTDGEFDDIPFDRVQLALHDSLKEGSKFLEGKNHLINIGKFIAIKGGHYHLEGYGNLPLYEDGQIDLDVKFDGDILSMIPKWDGFFIDGASFSTINLKISGTPSRPRIVKGIIEIDRGELWLKDVAEHIDKISGKIEIEEYTNRVIFKNIYAEVSGNSLVVNTVYNVKTSDGKELDPWYFEDLDLDFGILAMETSKGGVELHIPGLMADSEYGRIDLSGRAVNEKFYFAGPVHEPHAWGTVIFSDARFTFPFPKGKSEEPTKAVRFLRRIHWDVSVTVGEDLQYVRTIPAFLGEVDLDLNVDPGSKGLVFTGVLDGDTFKPLGVLYSSRGHVDYLDMNFRVDNFGAIFNKIEVEPEVYGRAWTTVRDSVGIAKTIYLDLYAFDSETGQESRRARWEDFRFKLSSADPTIGETQEQVLAYLGYSVENIKEKATEVGGAVTENYVIRPLLRPIEKQIEHYLGFDIVRINSRIAQNLFQVSLGHSMGYNDIYTRSLFYTDISPYALLFESSELTVGKYLSKDLYLSYTGQLVAAANETQSQFNFNHSLGLEYRLYQNLLLEFQYDREALRYLNLYSNKPYQEDFKIRLRHSFSF